MSREAVARVRENLVNLGFALEEEPAGLWDQFREEMWLVGKASPAESALLGGHRSYADSSLTDANRQIVLVGQIRDAIHRDAELLLYCQSRGSRLEFLSLNPRDVYQAERGWVVEGYCHQQRREVSLRLSRVRSLSVAPKGSQE
ncbi:MAG: hypothetical protein Q8P22_12675 [Chloroflexota bacterium]|nr:hypothetical protein [Chloroflexota bacterium]